MKKRILRIVGIVVLLIIGVLVAAPFILEAKIGELIKNNVNNTVNATLDFNDADLSLIKSFPNAEVQLSGVTLINKAPFEGDTLFAADNLELVMGIGELFKGQGEAIGIQRILLDGANLNIKINEAEEANYDITEESESQTASNDATDGFVFNLESYEILNSTVQYKDMSSVFDYFGIGNIYRSVGKF